MWRRTSRSRAVSWSSSGSATPVRSPWKASSTNPARRGENTASPPWTRRMAAARSGGEMVLVTYPRAPARITPMTSVAASDTDRARKRISWSVWRTASRTARPPPPGRWTSSRTTSGRVRRMPSTAASTSPASPTISNSPPSSARSPERKKWWSSTRKTLIIGAPPWGSPNPSVSRLAPRQAQLDLGALAGGGEDGDGAAVAPDPAADGVGDAAPVGRHLVGVEALALVAHEPAEVVRLHLDVHRDQRRPRVPGRVERRLLAGVDQGPAGLVERGVADHDDVDGHVVALLDPGRDRLDGRPQPALGRHRDPVQPGPQLPLLAPGQPDHLGRGVGPLDQGQGVQDRVVEVGGHLGPGLGADPATALVGQLGGQPGRPGGEDQHQPDQGDGHPEEGVAGRGQVGAGVGEPEAEAAGHKQAADHDPDQADPAGEHGLDGVAGDAGPAGPVAVVAAGPDDRRAGRGQGDRPDDLVAEPQADLAQQQHRPEHHQPEGEGLPGRRPADGPGPGQLVVRLDRDRPGQQVEHDPGAAGDGQDGEGDPDKDRVDAEPFAQPAGHAQQHAVVAAADDRRRAGRPLGDLGRRGSSPPRVGRVPGGHGGTRPSARPWGSTLSGRGPDRGSARVIPDGGRAGGGAGCSTNVPSPHEEQPHVRASPRGPARGAGATSAPAPAPASDRAAAGPAPGTVRRLTRRTDNKMLAGVASGIAAYLGIEPWIVRIGFVILVPFGGFGALAYLIAWLLVPVEGSQQSLAGDVLRRPPSGWRGYLGVALILLAVAILASAFSEPGVIWAILLIAFGVFLFRQEEPPDRRPPPPGGGPGPAVTATAQLPAVPSATTTTEPLGPPPSDPGSGPGPGPGRGALAL